MSVNFFFKFLGGLSVESFELSGELCLAVGYRQCGVVWVGVSSGVFSSEVSAAGCSVEWISVE